MLLGPSCKWSKTSRNPALWTLQRYQLWLWSWGATTASHRAEAKPEQCRNYLTGGMHNGITMHHVYVCFCTHRVVVESSVQEIKECERMLVSHFWIFMIRFGCSLAGQSFSMIRLEGGMVAHVFCPGMLCGFVSLWIPEFLQLLICRSTGVQQVFPSTSDGTKRQLLEVPLVLSFPNLRKQRYALKAPLWGLESSLKKNRCFIQVFAKCLI